MDFKYHTIAPDCLVASTGAPRGVGRESEAISDEARLTTIATMVLWTACMAIGIAGLVVRAKGPLIPSISPVPVRAELIKVQIAKEPSPPAQQPAAPTPEPPSSPMESPPPAPAPTPAERTAPPLVAVAIPSQAIQFAKPIEGPVRIAATAEAAPSPPVPAPATAVSPGVQHLVYGQGEGQQPAPDYPREAALAHQQGVVSIGFSVGSDGAVTSAHIISPSPFAILNQSALRAVRESWRFPAGSARLYEVSIQFKLARQ